MEVSVCYLVIKISRAQIISSRKGDECHPHLKQIRKRSALEGRLANNESNAGDLSPRNGSCKTVHTVHNL